MADHDKYKKKSDIEEDKKKHFLSDEETGDDSGSTGTSGGAAGQIEFRDFLAGSESLRDDLLPPEEKRRLLAVHQSEHEQRVKKQKEKRDLLNSVKDKKIPLKTYREGLMGSNPYKVHFLSSTVQFGSGITDKNMNSVPNENNAETNNEKRKELQLNYDLVNRPELANQQKFIPPKPTPYNR